MTPAELVEELELSRPEKVATFERRYPEAMAAIAEDDLGACDPDELDDLVNVYAHSSGSDGVERRWSSLASRAKQQRDVATSRPLLVVQSESAQIAR